MAHISLTGNGEAHGVSSRYQPCSTVYFTVTEYRQSRNVAQLAPLSSCPHNLLTLTHHTFVLWMQLLTVEIHS